MTIKNILVGYKDSPLGIIPQEWEVKRLGEVCKNKGDYGINAPAVEYSEILPTYLRITDIDDSGRCCFNNKVSVNNIESCNYLLYEGDIVFARTGATVGKSYLYNLADGILVFAGFLIRFSINTQKLIPYFLKSYVETNQYWNWVKITSQRSGQPGINAIEYCSLNLPLPPLPEQKKIAEILSTWDKAIEKQTQLIQKLELRKKGLMQQLLTGKKRLPGFTGEWKKVKLGEITTFLSCNTFSREQMNNVSGNLKNVHYGDVLVKYSFIVDVSKYKDSIPYINDMIEYSPKDYVESGDIVMADTAEDEMVGRACEFTNVGEQKIISGLHTILIRPIIQFAPMFLGYYLNSREYHKQILSIMQGIKVYSITKEALKNTTIKYPTMQEQTAIANILSSCDEEIRLAQDKLAAMKEQKKGLMQVLLTGKKRVKI